MTYDYEEGELLPSSKSHEQKTEIKDQGRKSTEPATRPRQTTFFVKFENNIKIPSLSTKSEPSFESTKRPLTNLSNRFSSINDSAKPIETNILNWQLEDNTAKTQKIYKSLAELYEVPFHYTLEENNNFYASGHNPQYASVNPYLKGIIEFLSSLNEHDINSPIGLQWEKKLRMLNVICSNMPYKSNISDSFRMCPQLNKDVLFSVFNLMKLEDSKSKHVLTTTAPTAAAPGLNHDLNIFDDNMTNNGYENDLISSIMSDKDLFRNEPKIGPPPTNSPSDQETNKQPIIELQRIFNTHKKQEQGELVSLLASLIINILLKVCFLTIPNKKLVKLDGQKHSIDDPDYLFFKYIFYMTPEHCTTNSFTMYSAEQLQDTQMFLNLQGYLFSRLKSGNLHISDLTNYYKMIKNQFIQFLKDMETKPKDQRMSLVDFKLKMFDHIFSTTLDLAYNNQCQFPIIKEVLKPALKVINTDSSTAITSSPAIDPRTVKQQDLSYTDSYEFQLITSFHFKQTEGCQDSSKDENNNLAPTDMDISAVNTQKSKKSLSGDLTEVDYANFNENCIDILPICSFKPLSGPLNLTQTVAGSQSSTSKLRSDESDYQLNNYLDTYESSLLPSSTLPNKNYEEDVSVKSKATIFDRLGKNSNEDEPVHLDNKYVHPDDEDWDQNSSVRARSTVFERLGRKSERDISNISPSPKRSRSCNRYSSEYGA